MPHKVPIVHGFLQSIIIGRNTVFQVEQPVGIAVHLVFGRGGQAHQQRIEIIKDGSIFMEDRTMRLVDDDQIKMADAEAPPAVEGFVDQPHHGRIGRDVHAPFGILLGDEVHRRRIGQVSLEGIDCLPDQSDPVGQE